MAEKVAPRPAPADEIADAGTQQPARGGRRVVEERVRAEGVPGERDVVEEHAVGWKAYPAAQLAPGHHVDVMRQDQRDLLNAQAGPRHGGLDYPGKQRGVFLFIAGSHGGLVGQAPEELPPGARSVG